MTQDFKTGRPVRYAARHAKGRGVIAQVYDTRTGRWYVVTDAKTGAAVACRASQLTLRK